MRHEQLIMKDEDGKELLQKLELEKYKIKDHGEPLAAEEMHRRFHYAVVVWLQKHGFRVNE